MGLSLNTNKKQNKNLFFASKIQTIFWFFLSFIVITLEFFSDVNADIISRRIVVGSDYVLIALYFLHLIIWLFCSRKKLKEFFYNHKTDIFIALVVIFLLGAPRIAAIVIISRLFSASLTKLFDSAAGTYLVLILNLRPSQTLALSFLGIITFGSILLCFPAATVDGKGASLVGALFTMTSATCVSGLVAYDIGTYFTKFGQIVIMLGIQAGGLGIMVLSAAFAVMVGGTIPSRRQAGLREVLDVSTSDGLRSLIKAVAFSTFIVEITGALTLFLLNPNQITKVVDRGFWSLFHSISAFCNAGISLNSDSLVDYVGSFSTCITFMLLITIGGLGFFVILDLFQSENWVIKSPSAIWNRLQIQTKVVLIATLILNASGMILFLFFEYDGALAGLSVKDKLLASLFQAVSLRSAGFNTVSMNYLSSPTILFFIIFMFIGAAPGSTGGGIKTTTAAISFMALRSMLRGRSDVELMGRKMESSVVSRSLSIVLISGIILSVFLTLLLATQSIAFEKILFETVSAFGTVGLSLNTTQNLDAVGKVLITIVMYVGRIGPLTLALAVGEKKMSQGFQLPSGRIAIG